MSINGITSSTKVSEGQKIIAKRQEENRGKPVERDSFERSNPLDNNPNYVKYPYGSPELAQAILASACYRIPDKPKIIRSEDNEKENFTIEPSEKSCNTHNNETHHYNQQDSGEKDDSEKYQRQSNDVEDQYSITDD